MRVYYTREKLKNQLKKNVQILKRKETNYIFFQKIFIKYEKKKKEKKNIYIFFIKKTFSINFEKYNF